MEMELPLGRLALFCVGVGLMSAHSVNVSEATELSKTAEIIFRVA